MISPYFLVLTFMKIDLVRCQMFRSFFDDLSFATVTFEVVILPFIDS